MTRAELDGFTARMDRHTAPMQAPPTAGGREIAALLALPPTEQTLWVLERTIDLCGMSDVQASTVWLRMVGVAALLDYGREAGGETR